MVVVWVVWYLYMWISRVIWCFRIFKLFFFWYFLDFKIWWREVFFFFYLDEFIFFYYWVCCCILVGIIYFCYRDEREGEVWWVLCCFFRLRGVIGSELVFGIELWILILGLEVWKGYWFFKKKGMLFGDGFRLVCCMMLSGW